jgi:hypothetical protein
MEKKKIDRVIEAFRNYRSLKEEGVPTMSTGSTVGNPGFSGAADAKGPTAGFDPVIGFTRRKGPQIKLPPGSRKRWMKPKS